MQLEIEFAEIDRRIWIFYFLYYLPRRYILTGYDTGQIDKLDFTTVFGITYRRQQPATTLETGDTMNYRARLATNRRKEIETHRYFLLFQEYLDKLEKEQPKGGEKENATRHKAVSSPL